MGWIWGLGYRDFRGGVDLPLKDFVLWLVFTVIMIAIVMILDISIINSLIAIAIATVSVIIVNYLWKRRSK